jgi:hypothetical protein
MVVSDETPWTRASRQRKAEMLKRSAALTGTSLACALITGAVLIPTAGAQSSEVTAAPGPTVCVEHLVPTGPADVQGNIPTTAQSQGCFQNQDGALSAIAAASQTNIGKDWEDSQQRGDSLIWTADAGCTANRGYNLPDIGNAWDNRISSSIGKNGCNRFRHFEGVAYSGSLIVCTLSDIPCYQMGAMNDETTSEKWRHE